MSYICTANAINANVVNMLHHLFICAEWFQQITHFAMPLVVHPCIFPSHTSSKRRGFTIVLQVTSIAEVVIVDFGWFDIVGGGSISLGGG
jgi:hypothetical protein